MYNLKDPEVFHFISMTKLVSCHTYMISDLSRVMGFCVSVNPTVICLVIKTITLYLKLSHLYSVHQTHIMVISEIFSIRFIIFFPF